MKGNNEMLTNQAIKILKNTMCYNGLLPFTSDLSTSNTGRTVLKVKDITGLITQNFIPVTPHSANYNLIPSSLTNTSSGVAIGSGTTPLDIDSLTGGCRDYTLDNQIVGFSSSSSSISPRVSSNLDIINNKFTISLDYTITNNNYDLIIINELGYFQSFYSNNTKGASASANSASRYCIMMDRSILELPIVISKGLLGSIRYTFTYNFDFN